MTEVVDRGLKKIGITVSKPVLAVICIVFGILVMLFSWLLNIIVGIFLILQGVLLVTDYMELKRQQPQQTQSAQPISQ